MKIGQALTGQPFCDVVEQGLRVAVCYIVLRVLRRNAHSSAFGADGGTDGIDDFHQEPTAILDVTAVAVRAFIGLVAQKLIDQIAVGGMHLHAVEPAAEALRAA
jgi:hypothetical protein